MVNAAIGAAAVLFLVKIWPWLRKRLEDQLDERIDLRIKHYKEKKDE